LSPVVLAVGLMVNVIQTINKSWIPLDLNCDSAVSPNDSFFREYNVRISSL
jgi:hypothetical protein